MKITKAEGQTCLEVYRTIAENPGASVFASGLEDARPALRKLGWCDYSASIDTPIFFDLSKHHTIVIDEVLTALALAITLSGVEVA